MFGPREYETTFQHFLRLSAQTLDVLGLAVIILFLIAEDLGLSYMSAVEWAGFIFFPIGVFIGLVLAWREELLGGLLTTASVAGFYLVYGRMLNSSIRQSWVFLPFLLPAILFIVYGSIRGVKATALRPS
jgi:hypothetical protein